MKKPVTLAVAAVAAIAGARWCYSPRSASLALAPIEKQSLHDAPNDGQGKIDLQKFGLDSAGAEPVASPAAAVPAGVAASGQSSGRLERGQMKRLEALANYVRQNGKMVNDNGLGGIWQRLTKGLLIKHVFTAINDASAP